MVAIFLVLDAFQGELLRDKEKWIIVLYVLNQRRSAVPDPGLGVG